MPIHKPDREHNGSLHHSRGSALQSHTGSLGDFPGNLRGAAMSKFSSQFLVERMNQEKPIAWCWLCLTEITMKFIFSVPVF